MKHLSRMTLLSALALAAGLTACQREQVSTDEGEDGIKEVTTQFVFNISTAQTQTKQTAEATQAVTGSTFRGLANAKLLTYSQEDNGKILSVDATADKMYDLATLVGPSGVTSSNTRRVLEMSLPLKTNTLVLYGRAPAAADNVGTAWPNNYDLYGHMETYSVTDEQGSADFVIGTRLPEGSASDTKYRLVEKVIAGIMSCGMNTSIGSADSFEAEEVPSGGSHPYGYTVTACSPVSWSSYANSNNSPVETGHLQYPLEEKMGKAYKAVTTISSAEIRAGSGLAIESTIQDMWTIINEVRCSEPINVAEAHAKFLAQRVHTKLTKTFEATVPTTGMPVTGVDFKYPKDFATDLDSDTAQWPVNTGNAARPTKTQIESLGSLDLSLFPTYFNIPRGASHYTFDSNTGLFSYVKNFDTSAMDGIQDGTKYGINSYYYPAELMYFGNSPIRVSDSDHKADTYPGDQATTGNWETAASWTTGGWTPDAAVTSTTRAVAMTYNVNYGTALLKTQVKYGAATLYDNNHAIQKAKDNSLIDPPTTNPNDQENCDEPNKPIAVSAGKFLLTGIIVGGQPHKVGWHYLPVKEDNKYVTGFIYDGVIPEGAASVPDYTSNANDGKSDPVYTAVLDNYNAEGNQHTVYIALEFQNKTGSDFYGLSNLIKNNGYFYLIGGLNPYVLDSDGNPTSTLKDVTWPDLYQVPPYTDQGVSAKIPRVFIQDYMTSVTFKLGVNSLKYAYLTVPDLRSSSLTVGLSVDMTWNTGINFNDVILGGN